MSQQSATSSTLTGSFLARAQFMQAHRKLFALQLSEDSKVDKTSAREWVGLFGKAMALLFSFFFAHADFGLFQTGGLGYLCGGAWGHPGG